ncbi:DEAD/DEAH box helicase [Nocardia sp. NPDC051787]|uniref:DEAD/DEAH box helicase n=1 Tax=Nocardia sp. NPDC051787 TaxID=3155415 RepID=UPI0034376CFB
MTPSTTVAAAPTVTFAELGLPAVLVQALRRDGIEMPFPIQAATVPDVLAAKDVLGRGPTGSGKTLAFGLPMLTRLAGAPAKPGRPRGLVLVPTRELAAQIERALDEPALALGLRVASVVGGAPIKRQADRLARGVDLLIATPGRLADLLAQGSADLSDVAITALDEADHMADMGFLPQVTKLLDRTPRDGQRLLFSATLDGEVDKLVKRYLRAPVTHSTAPPSASVATMSHHLLYVRDKVAKRAVATEIAARDGLTIMFVRTKHGADRLAKQLRGAGIATGALHGGKAQNNRTRTLAAFADGSVPVLVTTDVAARGIHVDGISLVVHVDPPAEPKAYLHRAGRTARAGEDGVVVTLVMDDERRAVEAMARKAGVEVDGVEVRPGDRTLIAITGARRPSGVPVAPSAAPTSTAVTDTPKPARRKPGRRGEPAAAGNHGTGAAAQPGRSRKTPATGTPKSARRKPGQREEPAVVTGRGPKAAAQSGGRYGAGRVSGPVTARRGGEAGKPAAGKSVARTADAVPVRNSGAGEFSRPAAGPASGDTAGRTRRRAVRSQQPPPRGNRGAH